MKTIQIKATKEEKLPNYALRYASKSWSITNSHRNLGIGRTIIE